MDWIGSAVACRTPRCPGPRPLAPFGQLAICVEAGAGSLLLDAMQRGQLDNGIAELDTALDYCIFAILNRKISRVKSWKNIVYPAKGSVPIVVAQAPFESASISDYDEPAIVNPATPRSQNQTAESLAM